MTDAQGTVRFKPIDGDDGHVLMIEELWLRHPYCPIVAVEPYGIVLEPADQSQADAIARFERAGGVVLRDGTVTMPKTDGMKW